MQKKGQVHGKLLNLCQFLPMDLKLSILITPFLHSVRACVIAKGRYRVYLTSSVPPLQFPMCTVKTHFQNRTKVFPFIM